MAAGAAAIAGAGGASGVAADLSSAPLAGSAASAPADDDVVATVTPDEAARAGAPAARGKPAKKSKAKAAAGDADLSGALDLSAMQEVGDHYEVKLGDGRTAVLTLDPELQHAAEKVLGQAKAPRGAVVVTALDGKILAYAGRRTEDPKGGKNGIVDYSLVNTAWAPAASVFKIVSASALLEAGVSPHDKVCYHGGLRSVMESNLVDDRHDDRCNDLAYGLAHSQNAIIAKLAHQHLEPEGLRSLAGTLGFADLPAWALGGVGGAVDIPADKGVDFAKTAAGFRGTELSPVGGALLANTIATGGLAVTPTIVAAVVDADGTRHELTLPATSRVLPEDVATEVGDMMVQTCDSGSAAKAFRGKDGLPRSVKVAGKTGTLAKDQPLPLEYSWFVGYAPADKPAYSIAVVLGNTDLWWLKGHTAARMVIARALKH